MALPSSGALSLSVVNTELNKSAFAAISMGDADVRALFGKPSGVISLSDGYGKSASFVKTLTIAANTQNYNIRSAAIAAGWDEVTPANVTVVINAGVYVGASSTANFGITTGSFPAGSVITIVNNGYIVGCGGAGGQGGSKYGSGGSGGSAISMNYPVTIQNNGSIFGGGGGGGGGAGSAIRKNGFALTWGGTNGASTTYVKGAVV